MIADWDFFRDTNYAEAGLWILMGIGFGVQGLRSAVGRRRNLLLSITLIAFGVSDIVEAGTGAWWRPWWLLAWKGVCVVMLLGVLLSHIRRARRTPDDSLKEPRGTSR